MTPKTEKEMTDNGICSCHCETAGSGMATSCLREPRLYPVPVKVEGGAKQELQLNPGDTVMDVRQFLRDAHETCFFTCYDLLLHDREDSVHYLEDCTEISEVADITTGSCFLEMVAALYDDRSVRAHVHRSRELIFSKMLHHSVSTSLALQYKEKSSPVASSGSVRIDLPEIDGLGFIDNVACSLNDLLSPPPKDIKCVESIVFSSFNPPPNYRRLVGDLIYLDVISLEGEKFCITGSTTSFYVNSSTKNTLDPVKRKSTHEATTLIGLLRKLSPKFNKYFPEILKHKCLAHPFENIPSSLPSNPWLELYTVGGHKRDASRAENSLKVSFGVELIGMQRDWNEELQVYREFPHTTAQERIVRDRAVYKVTSDFVDAAKSGAVGVISKCIPPINPADAECFRMYVHNNIFFSFAVDTDMEELSRKLSPVSDTTRENGSSNSLKNDVNCIHVDGSTDTSTGKCRNSSNAVGNGCTVEKSPDLTAEMQFSESERTTYASANNDLHGTRACLEADLPGLYNLAMAIIDYRGHRVIAQSVLPGILQGDKSNSLLYGSVDDGKKIFWNEDFHAKALEAAKLLHMKEHTVFDGSGNEFRLATPVECKGIVGSDDRHYLLDLIRVTPRDANSMGPGSRFCVLRPELITSFRQAEASERSKGQEKHIDADCTEMMKNLEQSVVLADSCGRTEEQTEGNVSSSFSAGCTENNVEIGIEASIKRTGEIKNDENDQLATNEPKDVANKILQHDPQSFESKPNGELEKPEAIIFNPNVFTEFKLGGSEEEIRSDEQVVRKASLYLTDKVIPKFIDDLCLLEVSPMDGQTLTEALHTHGINIRYVGSVAKGIKHLPHFWDLCVNEIVVRSAKHILKDILRDAEDFEIGPAISHFFNCFFGNYELAFQNVPNSIQSNILKKVTNGLQGKPSRVQKNSKGGFFSGRKQSLYKNMCSSNLWSDITEFSKLKYQFDLPEDVRSKVKRVAVIRNLCQKVGITISARKYDLSADTPFNVIDILNIQPLAKHSIPISLEAKNFFDAGKALLAEGLLNEAYTQFAEAYSVFLQITGPIHRDVALCCRYLAMVLYHVGDMAGAIMQQHNELIINERCLGLDHPDTAHSYGNMALFYHGLNQTELGLRHMSRGLLLLAISCGPDHPDVATTYRNIATVYQDVGKMDTCLRYLQESLNKNVRLLGEHHVQTAISYHAFAIAFNCIGAFKLSHQHEKKTYDILVSLHGNDDIRAIDSQKWLNNFKMRELEMDARKQAEKFSDPVAAKAALDMSFDLLKSNPDLMDAFQAALDSSGGSLDPAAVKVAAKRFSERAARPGSEARKKTVQRGNLSRPPGGVSTPAQAPRPAGTRDGGGRVGVLEGPAKVLATPGEGWNKKKRGKGGSRW